MRSPYERMFYTNTCSVSSPELEAEESGPATGRPPPDCGEASGELGEPPRILLRSHKDRQTMVDLVPRLGDPCCPPSWAWRPNSFWTATWKMRRGRPLRRDHPLVDCQLGWLGEPPAERICL